MSLCSPAVADTGIYAHRVVTLALGIRANAAIFTVVHAPYLKNLPVSAPKALLRIGDTNDCGRQWGAGWRRLLSFPDGDLAVCEEECARV